MLPIRDIRKLISYIERIIWDSLTHKFWGIITSPIENKKIQTVIVSPVYVMIQKTPIMRFKKEIH
jgi:hypothetical protein